MSSPESGSLLLAEEYFEREDDRFLDAIRSVAKIEQLAGFAGRWKKDHRPWARQQIFRYLERPLDRQGHQPVVKQLFKQAEEDNDDELMGAFLNAFDRLVRYRRKKQWRYDRQTQQATNEEILVIDRKIDRSVPPVISTRTGVNPFTGRELKFTVRSRPRPPFKYRTRYYLRRRAWRYFRRLGFGRPTEYCRAAARALSRYDDQTLTTGEAILESPGLLHICFGKSDRLEWTPSHVRLKEGAKLDDLKPRPCFPELWNEAAAFDVLLELVASVRSRLGAHLDSRHPDGSTPGAARQPRRLTDHQAARKRRRVRRRIRGPAIQPLQSIGKPPARYLVSSARNAEPRRDRLDLQGNGRACS